MKYKISRFRRRGQPWGAGYSGLYGGVCAVILRVQHVPLLAGILLAVIVYVLIELVFFRGAWRGRG